MLAQAAEAVPGPAVVRAGVAYEQKVGRPPGGGRVEWAAWLRGDATGSRTGGVVQHGRTQAAPGERCLCRRFDCRVVTPAGWCVEHGREAGPVAEWPADRLALHRPGWLARDGCRRPTRAVGWLSATADIDSLQPTIQ